MTLYIFLWLSLINLFFVLPYQWKLLDQWKLLAPGLEWTIINASQNSSKGDSRITVIRVDPSKWELLFAGTSQAGERLPKTAKEWCESNNLTLAINAGMFGEDGSTHIGYMKYRDHINNSHLNSYKSVIAFDPKDDRSVPSVKIFDLDSSGVTIQSILKGYKSMAQNLRLIKKPGINVWPQQDREWSEAAIGEDKDGNLLFVFSRSPFSMHDFNQELLSSGIGIIAAQHLEGGPEAQLYLKINGVELDLSGSYETNFNENNDYNSAWPIPNVFGLQPRK
jgi:hypothetical protein